MRNKDGGGSLFVKSVLLKSTLYLLSMKYTIIVCENENILSWKNEFDCFLSFLILTKMAPLPPPSFDSFPDLQPPISTAKVAKPTTSTPFNAPPSFNSFPEQKQQQQIDSNSDLSSRPTKRSKPSTSTSNHSFLDALEFELNSNGKELESTSSRKGRNDELNLESGNTIVSRSSKGKGRSRDQDQDEDRDRKRDSKRDGSSRHKDKESKSKRSEEKGKGKERGKERYGERDRDFGAVSVI